MVLIRKRTGVLPVMRYSWPRCEQAEKASAVPATRCRGRTLRWRGERSSMKEEWVELKLDSKRKVIMPKREMVNLAHRVRRVLATAKPVEPPIDIVTGRNVKVEPLFEATVLRPVKRSVQD